MVVHVCSMASWFIAGTCVYRISSCPETAKDEGKGLGGTDLCFAKLVMK